MNEQSYEEYIRSILGYPNIKRDSNNVYENNSYGISNQNTENSELENYYPEIYKIVYPMVMKRCKDNTKPITRELIEEMTDDIYMSVGIENDIDINITLNNEINSNAMQNRSSNYANRQTRRDMTHESSKIKQEPENRGEDRNFRNRSLRDLIKILLIRELLRRPNFPGNGRPQIPPPPRPPMRPRASDYYEDLYER